MAAKQRLPLPFPDHDSARKHKGKAPDWYREDGLTIMSPGEIAQALLRMRAQVEQTTAPKWRAPPVSPAVDPSPGKGPIPPVKGPPTAKGSNPPVKGPPTAKGPQQPTCAPPKALVPPTTKCPMTPPPAHVGSKEKATKMLRPKNSQQEQKGTSSADPHGSIYATPRINLTSPAPERQPPKAKPCPAHHVIEAQRAALKEQEDKALKEQEDKDMNEAIRQSIGFQKSLADAKEKMFQARVNMLLQQDLAKCPQVPPAQFLQPTSKSKSIAQVFSPIPPDPSPTDTPMPFTPLPCLQSFPPVPPLGITFVSPPTFAAAIPNSVLPPPPPVAPKPFVPPPKPPPAITPPALIQQPLVSPPLVSPFMNPGAYRMAQLENTVSMLCQMQNPTMAPLPPPLSHPPPSDPPQSDAPPPSKKPRVDESAQPSDTTTGDIPPTQPHQPTRHPTTRVVPPRNTLESENSVRLFHAFIKSEEGKKWMRSQPDFMDYTRSDPIFTPPGTPTDDANTSERRDQSASRNLRGTSDAKTSSSSGTTPTEPVPQRHDTQWQRPPGPIPEQLWSRCRAVAERSLTLAEQLHRFRGFLDAEQARLMDFLIF